MAVGARVSSLALTVATAFGRFRFSMPVDWPVTTTSSSLNGSGSRATVTVLSSAGTVTESRLNPIARTVSLWSPSGMLNTNRPSAADRVAIRVPSTEITASPTPWPVCSLVTRPLTWRTWAESAGTPATEQCNASSQQMS